MLNLRGRTLGGHGARALLGRRAASAAERGRGGGCRRGRWSHSAAALYISFVILHTKYAGRRANDFPARGRSLPQSGAWASGTQACARDWRREARVYRVKTSYFEVVIILGHPVPGFSTPAS